MLKKDNNLLHICLDAWTANADFRARRSRYKGFAYGRQWNDRMRTSDGRRITEWEAMVEQGRVPVTNNLIRQMIKSIIGRYRQLAMTRDREDDSTELAMIRASLDSEDMTMSRELDARALEEFLISGCAIQRCGPIPGEAPRLENVSPERFFYHRFLHTDGSDCRFMGMLHDMPLIQVAKGFAHTRAEAEEIFAIYNGAEAQAGPAPASEDFAIPSLPGRVRVIEVWRRQTAIYSYVKTDEGVLDRTYGNYEAAMEYAASIKGKPGAEGLKVSRCVNDHWIQTFLTPGGHILSQVLSYDPAPPFVMCFYPLIDGEIHSLVEDVIDQQKYINRLVTLLDDIMASSAKGVLLFPTEQLPEGFTWRDIRRIWGSPNSVIPYRNTRHGKPEQVTTGGVHAGADRMLDLQLRLFDEISGAGGAIRGRSSTAQGAEMLRQELEAGTVSMLDLLGVFSAFVARRDVLLPNL